VSARALFADLGLDLPTGDRVNVQCFSNPDAHAHGDRNPSCEVKTSSGRFKCHACGAWGDGFDAAVALGKSKREAMELLERHGLVDRSNGHREIVETYSYVDERGVPLFEVVRFSPKDFRQRLPDGTWKLGQTRRVLYRLPKVLEAVRAGDGVFVVEGERDVHALEAQGIVATCNPGGAGKWREEYGEALRGADVVVVADRDKAGREHALEVARSLEGTAASVDVVEPAVGSDISDHLAAGKGIGQLVPVSPVGDTPPEQLARVQHPADGVSSISFEDIEPEAIRWLWPGYVPLGMLTLLVGDPGLGKSLLTCELAARTSRAGGSVLLASAEDSKGATVRPRLEAADADLGRVYSISLRRDGVEEGIALPDDVAQLEQLVVDRAARLVVIDPLMAHLPEAVNSWRDQSVRRALAPLHRMAEAHGCAVLVVAHLNKDRQGHALYRTGGSVGIPAAVRSALLLARDPDDEDGERGSQRVLAHFKCNIGTEQPSLSCRVETTTVGPLEAPLIRILGESGVDANALLQADHGEGRSEVDEAADFLCSELGDGPRPASDVVKAARGAGIAEKTLRRAKDRLGVKSEKGGFGAGWSWRLPEDGHPEGGQPSPLARPPSLGMRVSAPSEGGSDPEGGQLSGSDHFRQGTAGEEAEVERLQAKFGEAA